MANEASGDMKVSEPLFTRVLSDLRQHRPQLAERLQANSAVLERVRDYEKQTALVLQQVSLAAARGEDIEKLALLDPVTELYNHRAFIKELKAELARAKRYKHPASLVMISIDGYDELSRQYGQLTCDALLKIASHAIRSALREVDVACKYSESNYGIILPQTSAAGASLVGERIRQRVGNQAIVHNWHNFSVTASVGVASFPEHASDYDVLIACAIEALDTALVRGGDRVVSV
ncbi:MAG TPA: GGDEF domain-containing protein [Candidatus Obscuribacter sp.]|jgi:diguanylate cyclase (GGDEF)-like protein|nr:GGDEF domain-containing protein [Candidatus Obscuribacter sp.]MBK9277177.1 GGDEF domain-containing protein [Candidatus Obscuribacter sp.]MBL8083241.1 GGDEF domain-containing protein [Candidatus Obscuribacter sp.]HMW88716.1 GGDEF domain-containing protein [Candidatus Obscuribacter sp.]HMX45549.1 GGDEF domain-containing protein [Candidatus Obscuribacter sp.]